MYHRHKIKGSHSLIIILFSIFQSTFRIVESIENLQTHPIKKVWNFHATGFNDTYTKHYLENYVDVKLSRFASPITSLSYCFRFSLHALYSQCLFDEGNISFQFYPDYDRISGQSGHGFLKFYKIFHIFQIPLETKIIPKMWHHICVAYEQSNNEQAQIRMTLDEHILFNNSIINFEPDSRTDFNFDKVWQLGKCRKATWVVHPLNIAFRGYLTDFNLWSKALSIEDMLAYTEHCISPSTTVLLTPDIVDWDTIIPKKMGKEVDLRTSSSVCSHKFGTTTLAFAIGNSFQNSKLTCSQLGGYMPLPKNKTELNNLIKIANPSKPECVQYWMPITQYNLNVSNGSYTWMGDPLLNRGSEETFLPWELGQPNGFLIQQCVIVDTRTGKYFDVECTPTDVSKYCLFCSFPKNINFYLRGIDSSQNVNSHYIFLPQLQKPNTIKLEGYYNWDVKWNMSAGMWYIEDPADEKKFTFEGNNNDQNFPFGKRNWKTPKNGDRQNWPTSTIKLTKVNYIISNNNQSFCILKT